MFLDKYGRAWQGPYPFTKESIENVSRLSIDNGPGLYQILYMKTPVYIGVSSVSFFGRLRKHVKGAGNQMAGKRADAAFYEFVYWACDGKTARQIESHVTVEEKPGFNQKIEYVNYIASIHVH